MTIIRFDPDELAAFGPARLSQDPAVHELYRLIKAEAEARGGVTLSVWKLHMGRLWGDATVRSSDEVARELGLPLSQVQSIIRETRGHVRDAWKQTQAYRDSEFADG
jgi:hypothetical protein